MKLIFLDRDGVINRFPGRENYVTSIHLFELLPNTVHAIRLLTDAGFEINVISNQGCVSKKLLSEAALEEMTDLMLKEIEKGGGKISGIFYCPHQTDDNCECRKPKIGLFKKALGSREPDLSNTYFVGDSQEDVEAGKKAGLRTILVLSGRSCKKDVRDFKIQPDQIKKDLMDAAQWIIRNTS